MPPVEEEAEKQAAPLSEEAKTALVQLVDGAMREEKFPRRQEVIEARRQRYYERGDQYIYFDSKAHIFKFASESGQAEGTYTGVYNIFRPHSRSLISVLSQNPPGVNFVPDDLNVSSDVTSANRAEKMRHRVDRDMRMKDVQTQIARFFCTDARTVAYSRIKDGKALVTAHGVLESKVPIYTSDIAEWDYAILPRERGLNGAKEQYPDDAAGLTASTSTGEGSFERNARLGVLGGTGSKVSSETQSDLITEYTAWIRPARYRKAADEVQAELKEHFPEGVRVVVMGERCCEAVSESMDTCLSVEFPSPGDGQNRPSLMKDMVPLQDAFNDGMNMLREHFDFSIPATWVDTSAVDEEALPDQRSQPGAIHTIQVPAGKSIADVIMQEQTPSMPAELGSFLENISGQLSQFITGDLPSLYGGDMEHNDTASGYSMAREQAMGGMAPAWSAMQGIFAKIYKQTIDAMAVELGDEEVSIPGATGKSDSFKASELLVGSYGCYPDTDSSFPETTAAKRAALQNVLTQLGGMEGGQSIAMQPDNLKLIKQISGVEDLVIPGAEARDKQSREIENLLRTKPVPPTPQELEQWQMQSQQAQASGQPAPAQPQPQTSVPIDEDFDYHKEEADKVQEWLSSDERVQEDRAGNVDGIQNVRLHGLAHRAALAKQQGPPQGKPMSISAKFTDLPPEAQAAELQKAGDPQATPDSAAEHQGMQDAKEIGKKLVN